MYTRRENPEIQVETAGPQFSGRGWQNLAEVSPIINREHILNEIQRVAIASKGSPPGRLKFASITGIHEHVWSRYWARWGDALTEAGFKPNRWGRGFADEELLEKLAAYARELGRYPVGREIRLKALHDAAFPSENPFRRFGSRKSLALRLRDYSLARGYEDLVPLCESVAKETLKREPRLQRQKARPTFVYLVKADSGYKISRSKAVLRREAKLVFGTKEKPQIVHSIRTDDPRGIATYWRRRFADCRDKTGSFRLSTDDVSAFRKRKFM
jgi:hypothetical protein